jgi:hypothetical protein
MTVTLTHFTHESFVIGAAAWPSRPRAAGKINKHSAQWRSALLQPIVCSNDATSTDNINCDTGDRHTLCGPNVNEAVSCSC